MTKMIKKNFLEMLMLILLVVIVGGGIVSAATFEVEDFSCPKDVAKDAGSFECTATIKNTVGGTATLNTLKLYPSTSWLELPGGQDYIGANGPGSTSDNQFAVKFSNLKAIAGGSNKGFSYIYLDDVQDLNVANDPDSKVNVVDIAVTTSNSASSAASGATFTTSPNVIVYGDGSIVLNFGVDSGGCSIGSQPSQKTTTITSNTYQQTWSPVTWTITQGSSGNCRFTLTATVTGTGGSTKTSTLSQTVTCSDCSTGGTTSSGGGGGGGAGGATTTAVTPVTELTKSLTSELGKDELLGFSFGGANHTLTVLNITDTTATIQIESAPQILTLALEEERQIDLNADGVNDISLKLKSINTITKKATFVLTPLNVLRAQGGGEETGTGGGGRGAPTTTKTEPGGGKSSINYILIILVALIAIVLIAIGIKLAVKAKREKI